MSKFDKEKFEVLRDIILDNGTKFNANSVWVKNNGCDIVVDRENTFNITIAKRGQYIRFFGSWAIYKGMEITSRCSYFLGQVNIFDNNQKEERDAIAAVLIYILNGHRK
jgi:hypothetical protein